MKDKLLRRIMRLEKLFYLVVKKFISPFIGNCVNGGLLHGLVDKYVYIVQNENLALFEKYKDDLFNYFFRRYDVPGYFLDVSYEQ